MNPGLPGHRPSSPKSPTTPDAALPDWRKARALIRPIAPSDLLTAVRIAHPRLAESRADATAREVGRLHRRASAGRSVEFGDKRCPRSGLEMRVARAKRVQGGSAAELPELLNCEASRRVRVRLLGSAESLAATLQALVGDVYRSNVDAAVSATRPSLVAQLLRHST